MSSGELERVEVMGRVGSGDLKLSDAAVMLELSYRQAKRKMELRASASHADC